MVDPHTSKVLLEVVAILRAHIANCTFIESASVRERNLSRLAVLEDAMIKGSKVSERPPETV
jgi:hypothetical protein